MPDGRAIAFTASDEQGRAGVFVQDFAPGEDTSPSGRPLLPFSAERPVESFAIAPAAQRAVPAVTDATDDLVSVSGLGGIEPPRPRR